MRGYEMPVSRGLPVSSDLCKPICSVIFISRRAFLHICKVLSSVTSSPHRHTDLIKRLCLITWHASTVRAPVSHTAIAIVVHGRFESAFVGVFVCVLLAGAFTEDVSDGVLLCAGAVVVVLPVV